MKNNLLFLLTQKHELAGNFDSNGVEWHPKGEATSVNAYDYLTKTIGMSALYGVFDI
ncbi:MAG: hypothetical protein LBS88_10795 [Tannerellaceae bacterium]|nr:hypothetical protein [Tannerellaceae bacterium]